MASFNQVTLVGRLTRDVETRSFANGGMVAKFGFAVDGKRSKGDDGQWKSEPVFIDIEAFNRGEKGKLASTCEQYLVKGRQCLIVGKLVLQSWTSSDGQKRSKLLVEADDVQFLDSNKQAATTQPQSDPQTTDDVANLFS